MKSKMKVLNMVLLGLLVAVQASATPRILRQGSRLLGTSTQIRMEVDVPYTQGSDKLDILFVIDDSGSMSAHQQTLADNIDSLVDASIRSGINLHVGVISTSVSAPPPPPFPTPTPAPAPAPPVAPFMGQWVNGDGQLIGPTKRFASSADSSFKADLKQNLGAAMTTNGDGIEQPFEAVRLALSEPNLSTVNAGFLRSDAALAIVLLTDADDQSPMDAAAFVSFLRTTKSSLSAMVYGAYVPAKLGTSSTCQRNSFDLPVKIEAVLATFGTTDLSVSLCDGQFGSKFAKLGDGMAILGLRQVQLKLVPDISSMKISYGATVLPAANLKSGWVYDEDQNSVLLGEKIKWTSEPAGTKLLIDYMVK